MKKKKRPNGIAIVVPVFNEASRIGKNIAKIKKYVDKLSVRSELIVVDDGSRDGTREILQAKSKELGFYLIVQKRNKGYGGALVAGLKDADARGYEYALFMDSDMTNHPKYLSGFVKFVGSGCDLVKASRYMNSGGVRGVYFLRRWISIIGNRLASFLYGVDVSDSTNGFRMVRIASISHHKFVETRFCLIMEEMYVMAKQNAKICEMPYVLTSRTDSKSSFKYNLETFWDYLKYPVRSFYERVLSL